MSRMFYQLFARPRHDHCNIIYDQAQDFVFHRKVELFQYNASLTIAGPIKGTFKEKISPEMVQKTLLLC